MRAAVATRVVDPRRRVERRLSRRERVSAKEAAGAGAGAGARAVCARAVPLVGGQAAARVLLLLRGEQRAHAARARVALAAAAAAERRGQVGVAGAHVPEHLAEGDLAAVAVAHRHVAVARPQRAGREARVAEEARVAAARRPVPDGDAQHRHLGVGDAHLRRLHPRRREAVGGHRLGGPHVAVARVVEVGRRGREGAAARLDDDARVDDGLGG